MGSLGHLSFRLQVLSSVQLACVSWFPQPPLSCPPALAMFQFSVGTVVYHITIYHPFCFLVSILHFIHSDISGDCQIICWSPNILRPLSDQTIKKKKRGKWAEFCLEFSLCGTLRLPVCGLQHPLSSILKKKMETFPLTLIVWSFSPLPKPSKTITKFHWSHPQLLLGSSDVIVAG